MSPRLRAFRWTAAAAAVTVILAAAPPRAAHPAASDMVTVYHLDGDTLMLEHSCRTGDHPRMRSEGLTDDGSIAFQLDGIANLVSTGAGHMGRARFRLDDDTLETRWTWVEEGEPAFDAVIQAQRVTRATHREAT